MAMAMATEQPKNRGGRPPLSLDVAHVIELYADHRESTRAIGARLGVSEGTIANRLRAAGIARRPPRGRRLRGRSPRLELDVALIVALYADRESTRAIGARLGASGSTI